MDQHPKMNGGLAPAVYCVLPQTKLGNALMKWIGDPTKYVRLCPGDFVSI